MVSQLKAQTREKKEKSDVLRKSGMIPAVFYGENVVNSLLTVSEKDFIKTLKEAGESSLIKLSVGSDSHSVLIHQLSRHPLSGKFLHIDFYKPSTKKKVDAEVDIVFVGESPAVKDKGGVLMKEVHFLKIKGLAKDLPREIVVDISQMKEIGDRILIKDITLAVDLVCENKETDLIAHIVEPRQEEETVAAPDRAEIGSASAEATESAKSGE